MFRVSEKKYAEKDCTVKCKIGFLANLMKQFHKTSDQDFISLFTLFHVLSGIPLGYLRLLLLTLCQIQFF